LARVGGNLHTAPGRADAPGRAEQLPDRTEGQVGLGVRLGLAVAIEEKTGVSLGDGAIRTDMLALSRTPLDLKVAARAAKDFAKADDIRKALKDMRVELQDTAAGTTWRVV